MPLESLKSDVVRENQGYSFSMRVSGSQQTVRVFVSDDALEGETALPSEEDLLAQLHSDREALEAVASEKYCQGRVAADGVVFITLSDLMKFIE
ncbi:MAG: hypothetical protein CTY15_01790 [Methylocystis sp.]|nr:MAG: hypothetical protein CTY15_01790 [Methylocystis sp.]